MQKLRQALAVFRAGFQSGARTLGISPKALGAATGAALAAGLAAIGATPEAIGDLIGVSPTIVAAATVTVAGSIAAWLLPPGVVIYDFDEPGDSH